MIKKAIGKISNIKKVKIMGCHENSKVEGPVRCPYGYID